MTPTTKLFSNGRNLEHPRLPGRQWWVSGGDGRTRFSDPSSPGSWIECDSAAVMEVGVDE
jgi:hypothetical protein